jgi:hypothetical protein
MRKTLMAIVIGVVATVAGAGPALACGGLIGRNGSVNLVRTTTLAAWHDGVEHYVTAFKFAGAGGEFGSIIPLPGVPTNVERGGDWTLQRLVREVTPVTRLARGEALATSAAAGDSAQVLLETRIDALDITVLKGGGQAVGEWATKNGFLLTPDTPEVLDFYARRSPIFLAAKFNGEAAVAKGVAVGDGTPVHLTIPTENPWVPLRILGVGLKTGERVNADVFLLTDKQPALLPGKSAPGLVLDRQGPATSSLLTDLRSDKGMEWMPQSMWLSYLKIDAAPGQLTYDLAVDATGADKPSPVAAGLEMAQPGDSPVVGLAGANSGSPVWPWALGGAVALAGVTGGVLVASRRR